MPHHRLNPDPSDPPTDWHAQELLLMREVMRLVGRNLAPAFVLREMLHLMSELLGLNRGRMVLADDAAEGAERTASVRAVDAEPLFLFRTGCARRVCDER